MLSELCTQRLVLVCIRDEDGDVSPHMSSHNLFLFPSYREHGRYFLCFTDSSNSPFPGGHFAIGNSSSVIVTNMSAFAKRAFRNSNKLSISELKHAQKILF